MWGYTAIWVAWVLGGLYPWEGKAPPLMRIWAALSRQPLPGDEYDEHVADAVYSGDVIDTKAMAELADDAFDAKSSEPEWARERRKKRLQAESELMETEAAALKAEAEMHAKAQEYNKAVARAAVARERREKSKDE